MCRFLRSKEIQVFFPSVSFLMSLDPISYKEEVTSSVSFVGLTDPVWEKRKEKEAGG